MKFYLIFTFTILTILFKIKCDSVCSASMLITELTQDIKDNGKLDCLKKPLKAPTDRAESALEKKYRLDAAWDTDCAFEADYDWLKVAKDQYGMKTGLVDRDGKTVDNPFEGQADICELIRAFIAGGIFEGAKLEELTEDTFQGIDCAGPNDPDLQICAVSGGSSGQNYSWYILLEGISITANDTPKWELEQTSREKIEARKTATS